MPIIFAQALMMFPLLLSRFDASQGLAATLSDYTGFWYNFIFAFLVIVFTYFYTAVTVNPNMMARRFYSRSEARKEDRRLPRCNHVAYHPARIILPGYRGDTSGICDDVRDKQPVLPVLRRYLVAYPCRRSARHTAADRVASAHASLRRFDEDRTS